MSPKLYDVLWIWSECSYCLLLLYFFFMKYPCQIKEVLNLLGYLLILPCVVFSVSM